MPYVINKEPKSGARSDREPRPKARPSPKARESVLRSLSPRTRLIAGGALILILIGGLWLVFGAGGNSDDTPITNLPSGSPSARASAATTPGPTVSGAGPTGASSEGAPTTSATPSPNPGAPAGSSVAQGGGTLAAGSTGAPSHTTSADSSSGGYERMPGDADSDFGKSAWDLPGNARPVSSIPPRPAANGEYTRGPSSDPMDGQK